MHRPVSPSLLAAAAALLASLAQLAMQSAPTFSQESTTVRSYDGRTMPGAFVRIAVPERRARPERTITVTALRLPTTAEHPGRPIVFLMGGPGIQGVNGPGLVLKRPAPIARKLRRIGELLKQDPGWHGPTDLLAAARAARERLARNPATATVTDRRTGQPVRLPVSRDGFDAIAGLNLDDGRLPALLVSVAAGDDRVLTRFVDAAWNGFGGGTVGLMARAVNCAADRPDSRWRIIERESRTAPFGTPIDNASLTDDFCRAVGYEAPPVEFARPVSSSVPALLLTGTLDATNPVENARDVARGLPKAVLLDVESAAHEALPMPAVQDVVVDFLRGVDVRGRRIVATPPHFATVEEAVKPGPQRGR